MNKELDDDLHELLDQLDDELDQNSEGNPNLPPPATDERVIGEINQQAPMIQAQPMAEPMVESDEHPIVDLEKFKEQLDTVTTEVLDACRADRQETQDVINLMRNKIDNASGDPPRMYVDGLVKAVEVKSNINQTAVKIIEANAKVLASAKPNIKTQNNTLVAGNVELERILSQPVEDDDI